MALHFISFSTFKWKSNKNPPNRHLLGVFELRSGIMKFMHFICVFFSFRGNSCHSVVCRVVWVRVSVRSDIVKLSAATILNWDVWCEQVGFQFAIWYIMQSNNTIKYHNTNIRRINHFALVQLDFFLLLLSEVPIPLGGI